MCFCVFIRARGHPISTAGETARGVDVAAPGPAKAPAPEPFRVNVPLKDSDNERARGLVTLDRKFVTDVAAMTDLPLAVFEASTTKTWFGMSVVFERMRRVPSLEMASTFPVTEGNIFTDGGVVVGLSTISPLVPRRLWSVPRKAVVPVGVNTREFGTAGRRV